VKKKPVIGGRILVGGGHPMPLSKAIRANLILDGNVEIEALADSPRAAVGGAR
jgi:hypothetical protein